jgi:hypothetical protein
MRRDLDVDIDPWDDEGKVRDLSPSTFRFVAAVQVGLAVLAIAGAF